MKYVDGDLEEIKDKWSPSELNEKNMMKIIGFDILGNVDIAKLQLPILGFYYYDFLSLSMIEGEWKIINKLFTHVE